MELKSFISVSLGAANLLQPLRTCGAISIGKIPSSLVTSAVKCLRTRRHSRAIQILTMKRSDILVGVAKPSGNCLIFADTRRNVTENVLILINGKMADFD